MSGEETKTQSTKSSTHRGQHNQHHPPLHPRSAARRNETQINACKQILCKERRTTTLYDEIETCLQQMVHQSAPLRRLNVVSCKLRGCNKGWNVCTNSPLKEGSPFVGFLPLGRRHRCCLLSSLVGPQRIMSSILDECQPTLRKKQRQLHVYTVTGRSTCSCKRSHVGHRIEALQCTSS